MYIFYKIKELIRELKWKKQRYRRGFSDADCWELNYWLVSTLPKMIYNLRDMRHRST